VLFFIILITSLGLHAALIMQLPWRRHDNLPLREEKNIIAISMSAVRIRKEEKAEEKNRDQPKKVPPEKKPAVPEERVENRVAEAERSDREEVVEEDTRPKPSAAAQKTDEEQVSSLSMDEDHIKKLIASYRDAVHTRIKAARHYPLHARRLSQEGVVRVRFILKEDGTLKGDVDVIERCRYAALNNAAVDTVTRAHPYPPFPSGLGSREMTFTIDLDFRLDD
jgi:protein TonB